MKQLVLALILSLAACSSSTTNNGAGPEGSSTTDPVVGKACNSDPDCGSGYACKIDGASGPKCTPDRACTELECKGICLASGKIDVETGEPLPECMSDCAANEKCCSDSSSTSGKCVKTSTSTPSDDAGPAPKSIAWAGTWNATVEYDVSCDWAGSVKKGHQRHTLTVKVEGTSSLTATPTVPDSGWTSMSGTGDGSGATISGEFPFRDDSGSTVGSKDNSVTLRLNDVQSDKLVKGTIEGQGPSRFGARCTVANGAIEFAR